MQAGALIAIHELLGPPEMVVGTSAGSLNAVFYATEPSAKGLTLLKRAWREVKDSDVGVPSLLTSVRRLLAKQESLVSSKPLAAFLRSQLPPNVETFEQLYALHGIRTYAVAVCMESGKLRIFGQSGDDLVTDGLMSSTAIPPYYPPWNVEGLRYLDGGVYSKLPVEVAVEMGATQILAIDVCNAMGKLEATNNLLGIISYSTTMMIEEATERELRRVQQKGVPIYRIQLYAPEEVEFWDYRQARFLLEEGRKRTEQVFNLQPPRIYTRTGLWFMRVLARLGKPAPMVDVL
jgi:NTE family protein